MRRGVVTRSVLAPFVIATLLLVTGCGDGGILDVTGKPVITSVTFPAEIVADGRTYNGTISFSDPDGDIVLVEWTSNGIVLGSDDPHVRGQTRGTFGFTQTATSTGTYSLTVRLRDANGNSSATHTFSYTATAPTVIAYRVDAGQLRDEYEANEIAGDMKYKGKLIAVLGYVDSIGRDIMDTIYVVLVGSPGDWSGVQCYFPEREAASVAQLREGDFVTIVGVCARNSLFNVLVDDCRLE
jgi:hypothetical protein